MKTSSVFAICALSFVFAAGCGEPDSEGTDFDPPPNSTGSTGGGSSGDGGAEDGDSCAPIDACHVAYSMDGVCVQEPIADCAVCTATNGTQGTARNATECCAGCWFGPTCRNPSELDNNGCGLGGALCDTCLSSQYCVQGTCSWGPP
jgi:hypothetical protein